MSDAMYLPGELRVLVDKLQQKNDRSLERFAKEGVNVPQEAISNVRLMILLDFVLGDMDNEQRLAYEYRVQMQFEKMLADVQSQIVRARLTQGVNLNTVNGQRPSGGK